MDPVQLRETTLRVERGLRLGEFKYVDLDVRQSQVDEVKSTWPDDAKEFIRKRVTELTKGQPVTGPVVRQAMLDTMIEVVAPRRAKAKGTRLEHEVEAVLADFSISMLFGRAPDASTMGGPRKLGQAVIATRSAWETRPEQLVVKCDQASAAEAFVLGIPFSKAKKSLLAGWVRREELVLAKRGNKITDPDTCPWAATSYVLPLSGLRPMAEFLRVHAIKELQEGLVLEIVPKMVDFPILQPGRMQDFLATAEKSNDDFYKILGIDPPIKYGDQEQKAPQPPATAAPDKGLDF
jgi:hypothetical protein